MKKLFLIFLFCLFISSSVFAMGRHRPGHNYGDRNKHRGGGGVPEPASILLILAGGAAALGIKKIVKKK